MLRIIIYTLITIGIIICYVKYIETRGIFFPMKKIEFTPSDINLNFQDLYIKTVDNLKINGWFIPGNNAKYTILFLHGNAGNIGHRLEKVILFFKMNVNMFIIDYRGFGRSQGNPSEEGLYKDAKASYDYLVDTLKIKPEHIILYGESIGAAVAINLGSEVKIKALIVEGAFSCGKDVAKKIYPFLPSFLFSNKFDSLSKIKKINAPKLFIHSKTDEIIPFSLAKKLYDTADEPKKLVQLLGGHNTAFLDSQDTYVSSITSFIESLQEPCFNYLL